jgi:hypothetical protein
MGLSKVRKEKKKMNKGFNNDFEVEFELPKNDLNKLLKQYKKLKKYQKSSLYAVKTMDGTEEIVSSLVKEAEENPL